MHRPLKSFFFSIKIKNMKFKILFTSLIFIFFISQAIADSPKSLGKFKNWESFVAETNKGKICFAQTIPSKRLPKNFKRSDSRLFVTFRPKEEIKDEVSITSGHPYKSSTVTAKSGKNNFSFFSQENFAWLLDEKEEKSFIRLMKKATNLVITANATNGTQTADYYSMMGFTKSYNTAKKSCS